MTPDLLDILAYLVSRFFFGVVIVVGVASALAPLFIDFDDFKDPRS